METLDAALAWLQALPRGPLLGAMALLAAVENIFPPIPADVMVAFGAFLAARAQHSPWPPFLAVWLGNMAGVVFMFLLGRRFGTERVERRYRLDSTGQGDARVLDWYRRYGTWAFFLTRFIPGLRAVVPPVAGALRIPMPGALLAMAAASGLWYGAITWFAFRAGNNWGVLRATVARLGIWSAGIAIGLVLVGVGVALVLRRKSRGSTSAP
jgi:membrane protein DedA with SNARE-associated domain